MIAVFCKTWHPIGTGDFSASSQTSSSATRRTVFSRGLL